MASGRTNGQLNSTRGPKINSKQTSYPHILEPRNQQSSSDFRDKRKLPRLFSRVVDQTQRGSPGPVYFLTVCNSGLAATTAKKEARK